MNNTFTRQLSLAVTVGLGLFALLRSWGGPRFDVFGEPAELPKALLIMFAAVLIAAVLGGGLVRDKARAVGATLAVFSGVSVVVLLAQALPPALVH